jgi:glycosyl transferase family 25
METLNKAIENYNPKIINIVNTKTPIINKVIKQIFVINLLEDKVKRNYIITLMNKFKINFTLVVVETISDGTYQTLCPNAHISKGELGCCLSHLWCLNKIIQNNYENAIIFEDDIIFHKNFVNHFMKIDFNKIDLLLFGAHDYDFSSLNYKQVKENRLYHPDINTHNLYGAHANFYSLKGAKCMYQIRTSYISFFDKEYMLMFNYFKNTSFICYPNLVVSDVSRSSLNHTKNFFDEEEIDYYNRCFIHFNFKNYHFIYLNILNHYFMKNGIDEKNEENYGNYVSKTLQAYFLNTDKADIMKNRLSMDFFTLHDIKTIFS